MMPMTRGCSTIDSPWKENSSTRVASKARMENGEILASAF